MDGFDYLPSQGRSDKPTANYVTASQYDSAGRLHSQTYGNGQTQTHTYNGLPRLFRGWSTQGGRLANITTGSVQNLTYDYDAGGNILTISDSTAGPQTQTFTYDNLDRLTSAEAAGGTDGLYSESYTYDPSTGNLASKAGLNLTYGDTAHPHAATGLSNGNTYAYNAVGSTITRVIGADTFTLAYDGESRLKTVQKNGAALAEFKYDGDGTRVQSVINGAITKFVGAYEVTGSTVTKYYGGVAMRINGALSFLLTDHLGSNSIILDGTGAVVGKTLYKAWGEVRFASGTVSTDYTYTGQYSNTDDFGLMYYKARWYDPQLGRFTQADTLIPDAGMSVAWDRYAYISNRPIMSNDPSGHLTDEQILKLTKLSLDQINETPGLLAFLRGLMLGDYLRYRIPGPGPSSIDFTYIDFTAGLVDGQLSFSNGEGSSINLTDWLNQGHDVSRVDVWRKGVGDVAKNGEFFDGWETTLSNTTSVDTFGNYAKVGVISAAGSAAGFVAGCVVGSVAGLGGCAASGAVVSVAGGLGGLGVSLATDGRSSNPGAALGDQAMSYYFANGQSYTVIIRDGRVKATSNIYTTNQGELIYNGFWGTYK